VKIYSQNAARSTKYPVARLHAEPVNQSAHQVKQPANCRRIVHRAIQFPNGQQKNYDFKVLLLEGGDGAANGRFP
jgi:hypothetical protein